MKQKKSSFAFNALIAGSGLLLMATTNSALACGDPSTSYMGSVCATAANFCPRGYMTADGAIISISQNQALFSLLGAEFGGNGRSTFGLPDLRGRSPQGAGQGPGLKNRTLGEQSGNEEIALSQHDLPTHSHGAFFTPEGGGSGGSAAKVEVSTAAGTKKSPAKGDYLAAGKQGINSLANYVPDSGKGTTVELGGVSGGGSSSGGGTVVVQSAGSSTSFPIAAPRLALTYCINVQGTYPTRSK